MASGECDYPRRIRNVETWSDTMKRLEAENARLRGALEALLRYAGDYVAATYASAGRTRSMVEGCRGRLKDSFSAAQSALRGEEA